MKPTAPVRAPGAASASPPLLLPLRDAARALGLSVPTVRRLIIDGQLPRVRIRRRVLIPASALERLAARTE